MFEVVDQMGPSKHKQNIDFLRALLADLLTEQDSTRLSENKKAQCKQGISALKAAIDALEVQVYA